jgi:NADPH2:quinone reductase
MASGSFAAIPEAAKPGITRLSIGTLTPAQSAELTWRALALAASGALHPIIGQRFPLDRAADAHAAIEARATIGKTLLIASPQGPR